ncbi:MAG: glycosyltransferase [Infirmifilum sp.]
MVRVSFITFTRNSGKQLKLLLEHVRDAVDEIIVVDGYSVDDTVEVALSFGAKVYRRKPWGHVEPDRMFALRKASYDWILYLDTDERLSRKLKSELGDLIHKAEFEGFSALSTLRVDYDRSCGDVILGSFYNRQIRIYRKDRALYKGLVHELPIIHGKILDLSEEYSIIHYPDFNYRKMIFYAYLEALEYYEFNTRSLIRRELWKLTPISAPLIYLYHIILSIRQDKLYNKCTVMREFDLSMYETLVHTLVKFRGERRRALAKILSEKGLIKLLESRSEQVNSHTYERSVPI